MVDNPAHLLWNARINSETLPRNFDGLPTSEEEAYLIQADMISFAGLEVIGWKIGATAEQVFKVLGVNQPFVGPLFADYTYVNGDEVSVCEGDGLETEFTLQMKSDLPFRGKPYDRNEIEAAVASISPSFEIVGGRFEGEGAGAGFRLIADGGANVGMILGQAFTNWSSLDLRNHPVRLAVNGVGVHAGSPDILVWDHIFDAAGWVACHPALSNRGLRAGDYVMTGTCTGVTPLASGDSAEADFGVLGKVRATFA